MSLRADCSNFLLAYQEVGTTGPKGFNMPESTVSARTRFRLCESIPDSQKAINVASLVFKFSRRKLILLRKMLALERISDQTGYLVLTEDGAVLTSGGDLENDERVANIISSLVTLTSKVDPKAFPLHEPFEKISIKYKDHCYVICLSNKKIHVVKRKLPSPTIAIVEQQSTIDV